MLCYFVLLFVFFLFSFLWFIFVFCVFFFFFFKQKTAYEMRISDWSSDVCSSDLGIARGEHTLVEPEIVLEANADMAAKRGSLRRDLHLRCTGAKYRPAIIVAEQAIRCPLHVPHLLGMRPDTAEKPETYLDEPRTLQQAPDPEKGEVVKVVRVVEN